MNDDNEERKEYPRLQFSAAAPLRMLIPDVPKAEFEGLLHGVTSMECIIKTHPETITLVGDISGDGTITLRCPNCGIRVTSPADLLQNEGHKPDCFYYHEPGVAVFWTI